MQLNNREFIIGPGNVYESSTDLQTLSTSERFGFYMTQFNQAVEMSTLTDVFTQPLDGKVVGYDLKPEEYPQAVELCRIWNYLCDRMDEMRQYEFFSPGVPFFRRFCHIPDVFTRLAKQNEGLRLSPKAPHMFQTLELSREIEQRYLQIRSTITA